MAGNVDTVSGPSDSSDREVVAPKTDTGARIVAAKDEIDGSLKKPETTEEKPTLGNIEAQTKKAIEGSKLPKDYESKSEDEKRKIMEDKSNHPELYKMFEGVSLFLSSFLPESSELSATDKENFPDIISGKFLSKLPDSVKKLMTEWGKLLFDDDEQETEDSVKQRLSFNTNEYKKGIFERFASKSRTVKEALDICGSTEFRGAEVAYGRLACAQVATEILRRSGFLSKRINGIAETIPELKRRGWQQKSPSETPQPGWVVVWNRSANKTKNGEIMAGHGHIGIVISDDRKCVSNSSSQKTPRIHSIDYTRRGVQMYLCPPTTNA
ncbi:MAG: CHAP domain-containing protein [Candidatus Gracilibacteria bacterium]